MRIKQLFKIFAGISVGIKRIRQWIDYRNFSLVLAGECFLLCFHRRTKIWVLIWANFFIKNHFYEWFLKNPGKSIDRFVVPPISRPDLPNTRQRLPERLISELRHQDNGNYAWCHRQSQI